jgi:hypothetical protein
MTPIVFIVRDSDCRNSPGALMFDGTWIQDNHWYEPQNKLRGIIPLLMQDNSIIQFQYAALLKLRSHYLRFA